jgi:hypothetical protein
MNHSIAELATTRVEGADRTRIRFMLSFREPAGQRLDADTVAAWSAWHQRIGSSLEQPADPIRSVVSVGTHDKNTKDVIVSGVAIVVADDLEQARIWAERSPTVRHGGLVEVGRLVDLWPSGYFGTRP